MQQTLVRIVIVLGALLLAGCSANQMPGYQNTYYAYNVPQPYLDRIESEFRRYGLMNARVARDNVGRVQLKGSYQNEDAVDHAFTIVQSIVGLKSTSPFYPEDIKVKRWEIEASDAMKKAGMPSARGHQPARKVAVVIGISEFLDAGHLKPIPGVLDATVAWKHAEKAGYQVTSLLGPQATKANIEKTLADIEAGLGANDSLFIFISTHGTPPRPTHEGGDHRKMTIVAYDSGDRSINDKTAYELNLMETGVSDEVVQRLARKPSRNTRILIDTCYSGEMLKGIPDSSRGYILATNGGKPERAGVSLASWTGPAYTSKGIHFAGESATAPGKAGGVKPAGAAQGSPVDYGKAYTILTATSEGEESWAPDSEFIIQESGSPVMRAKGSFFTQSFFAFLDQYKGQIELSFEAAKKFTSRKVSEIGPPHGPVHQVPRTFSTQAAHQNNFDQ